MKPYLRLENIVVALKDAQPAAEDAAPHLVDHVDGMARNIWSEMKAAFTSEFEDTLNRMGWPSKNAVLDGLNEHEWTASVAKLLDLQDPSVYFSLRSFEVRHLMSSPGS